MKYISLVLVLLLVYCSAPKVSENTKETASAKHEAEMKKRAAADLFIKGNTEEMKGDIAEAILDYIEASKLDPQAGIFYVIGKNYYKLNKLPAAIRNTKIAVDMAPDEIEYNMLLAEIYNSAFLADSAAVIYENVISRDSTNLSAIYNLAAIYEKNKPLRSLELYNKLLEINGPEWTILFKVARLNEQMGNVDSTIATVRSLLKLNPSSVELKKLLIESLMKVQKFEDAKIEVDDALILFPDDVNLIEYKASILANLNKWVESKDEYLKIINNDDVDLEAKIGIGTIFISQSSIDSSAIGYAREIFEAIAKDTSDWQVNLYLGEISLREKDDSIAIDYFRKATSQASWNVEAWIRLGGILFDNQMYTEAAKNMEEAVKHFPDEFVINIILGLSYAQENFHELAEPYLAKAAKLQPNDFNALFAYGFTLNQVDKKDEAIKYLKMALNVNNNSQQVYSILGSIYSDKKMYKECDEAYEKALAIDSTDILTLNNYAYTLSERGEKLDYALKMVKIAIEGDPENSSYLDTIGWVYFKLGEYDKAHEFILKAVDAESDNSVLIEHLGDVLFKKGEKDKAIENWKKALELDTTNQLLKDKIEKEEL